MKFSGSVPIGIDRGDNRSRSVSDPTGTMDGLSARTSEPSRTRHLSLSRQDKTRAVPKDKVAEGTVKKSDKPSYGLKFFREKLQMTPFGRRFDPSRDTGMVVGPYRVIADKNRGVEPGFVALKDWTPKDTAKLSTPGHAFSVRADAFLDRGMHPWSGSHAVRSEAAKYLAARDPSVGFRPGKDDPFHFISRNPDLKAEVYGALKSSERVFPALKKHVMDNEKKFNTRHYVKLDYREAQGSGRGEERTYTLPKSNAKSFGFGAIGKFFHQMARRQTPDAINRDAMRESLANDLMSRFGIFAQKMKLVPTVYQPPNGPPVPKLLLDGTHMSGRNGEKFSDFEGAIVGGPRNGQLVKLGEDGKPVKNARGHYEVDTSIREMGRNKIFMLLLGDRDAIGSKGGNKGRVGNEFAAIDPGHSLETGGQNLMARKDIRSDMSFEQPSIFDGKCYKNFSIFDQSPFSERMEGVKELARLSKTNEDVAVFREYAATFGKDNPGLDFSGQIGEMEKAYLSRREHILDVFGDRLAVYDFDFSGVRSPMTPETAQRNTLDVLDALEKISSEHSWMSGNTELEYPMVKNRTEWQVKEQGDTLEFRAEGVGRSARRQLENFVAAQTPNGRYTIVEDNGSLVLRIPKADIGQAHGDFSMTALKRQDRVPV